MEKSKFSLESRPGKVSYVEFNGYDLKGYDPKYKHFILLDKKINPREYSGAYICSLLPKLDKNNNVYYIAYPHIPVITFEEMKEICLQDIFSHIPKRLFHSYAFSAYHNFIDMISTFTMPLSTLTFRMLVIYINEEIELDEIDSNIARKQYEVLCNNITSNMSSKDIKILCKSIDLDKTVRDFIQKLYTYYENKKYKEISRIIKLLFRRQSTDSMPYYLIPAQNSSNVFFYNQYKEKFPYGNNVTAAILYKNFESSIVNIPHTIITNGEYCLNYNFKMLDKRQLIVKMQKKKDITDFGIIYTANQILTLSSQFNNDKLKNYAILSAYSIIRVLGNGENFLG